MKYQYLSSSKQKLCNQELPLKIIVTSKYIGAIIGQEGNNIRNISKETKAHIMVDVNNPTVDQNGNAEKLVWITGTIENCSNACQKILEIIQKERENKKLNISYVELKIRIPNQLIGRLIGQKGSSIKKIMEESGASVYTNDSRSLFDYSLFPAYIDSNALERVITIHGKTAVIVCAAEYKISQKLRTYHYADLEKKANYPMNTTLSPLFSNLSPTNVHKFNRFNFCTSPVANVTKSFMFHPPNEHNNCAFNLAFKSNFVILKTRIYIPNSYISAFIENKNRYIRSIRRITDAKISVVCSLTKKKLFNDDSFVIKDQNAVNKSFEETNFKLHEKKLEKLSVDNKRILINEVGDAKEVSKCLKVDENQADIDSVEEQSIINDEDDSSYLTSVSPLILDKLDNEVKVIKDVDQSKKKNLSIYANDEHFVSIHGYDIQVYKAEYNIFQKIAKLSHCYMEELNLTSEIIVPAKILGRIIGIKGRNIRELQSITRAQINISDNQSEWKDNAEVSIEVTSSYSSLQAIQTHYCSLIAEFNNNNDKSIRNSEVNHSKVSPIVSKSNVNVLNATD